MDTDGQSGEFKIVGHKGVNGICGIVFVNDQPNLGALCGKQEVK
jgi:hypothetical protein